MVEAIKSGCYEGERLEENRWDEMLNQYYDLHGWDIKTGWQTKDIFVKLGIESAAERLSKNNLLIE